MAKSGKLTPSNIVVWVILALLIVGLAGFGATNFGGSVNAIGKVGDTEIGVTRYANALQQEIQRIEQQTGQQIGFSQAQQFGLDRAVLAQVIGLVALEDEAADLGISVSDETVARDVQKIQAFQGLDGTFDREAYRFALERANLNIDEFEASIRTEAARTLVQAAAVAGVSTPQAYTDTLYGFARETRDFSWGRIGEPELAEPVPAPTEQELKAFYDANADRFTLPESRRITFAWVTPDTLADSSDVDEETLRRIYEDRIAEYNVPERRLVERLVFGTVADAQAALDRIEADEATFEDIVAERGLELADIDMGDVDRDALSPEAAIAVFALDAPGLVGPVNSAIGPALYRINGILPARETSFKDVQDTLRGEAAVDVARRRIADLIEPSEDFLASGATLEELAIETDLDLGEILWTPDLSEGIAAYDEFRAAASAVQEGDFPEIADLSDGGIFALRLDEVVPPRVQPYEDVETAVIAGWNAEATALAAQGRADEILAEIEDGADPAELGLTLMAEQAMTRDAFVPDAPVELVTTAFAMAPDTWRKIDTENGAILVRLDAVHAAPEDDEAKQIKAQFARGAAQGYAQDLLDAFTRAVQAEVGIEINQAALNAVHAQFQ